MRKLLATCAVLIVCAAPLSGAIPQPTGRLVTDNANILKPSTVAEVETQLRSYEQRTTNEFAVLIVPTLDGMSVEEYATTVFHSWGIGKKGRDNGVLLVWSTGDRKVRIEVGYGLESSLPDGRAGDVIRQMTPQFQRSQWDAGIRLGVNGVIVALDAPAVSLIVPPLASPANDHFWFWFCVVAILIIVAALVLWIIFKDYDPNYTGSTKFSRDDDYSSGSGAYLAGYVAGRSSDSSSSSPSSNDSSSSSDSGFSFGGGDSGGGGASGSY